MAMSSKAYELVMAASMTVGRGRIARVVADAAHPGPADKVVDIGCGPGAAVREAARRGAAATGVDPSSLMLRIARWITAVRPTDNVSWLEGQAEHLPVPDGQATVVWAVNSQHHWSDRAAGLAEAWRALAPEGRIVIAERHVRPGAHSHGLTDDQASALASQLPDAGFGGVRVGPRRAGRRSLVIIEAIKGSG
jgi:ubiquinone/menaquinone biosynthesis C-methylase UbiE